MANTDLIFPAITPWILSSATKPSRSFCIFRWLSCTIRLSPTPDSEDWSKENHKNNTKYFADMVAYMDKIVGRIVDKLDALGLRDNTLLIFTGDNGTHKSIKSKIALRLHPGRQR